MRQLIKWNVNTKRGDQSSEVISKGEQRSNIILECHTKSQTYYQTTVQSILYKLIIVNVFHELT